MQNSALRYRTFGKPSEVLQLETDALNIHEFTQCVVQMISAPINPSDLIPITGAYRHRIVPPLVAGYEGVGRIVKAKNKALLGQRVLPLRGEGTWQNYVACHQDWIIPVPDFIDNSLAARGYINPLAAYLMLQHCNVVDKTILITAAGSSCANMIAQWARRFGAKRIIGIYRSPKHITHLQNMGVIPVSIDNYDEIVKYASQSDVVFDAVGGDLATLLLTNLPKNNRFISYGLLSNKMYQIDCNGVLPIRFHIRDYFSKITLAQWQYYFTEIWALLKVTQLPNVECFPLLQWRQAIDFYQQSGRINKPLLMMT